MKRNRPIADYYVSLFQVVIFKLSKNGSNKYKKETIKTLKTFEIAIPEEYAATIRKLIQGLGGKIKVRKEKKCGLDEALEDVKAGRVYHAESTEDLMKQIFG